MKKVQVKSAIPIYIAAAIWLLAGLIAPKLLMKLPGFIITAILSVGGWVVGWLVIPDRTIAVEDRIETGNAELDRDIADGRARLENLREANAAIKHPEITKNLDRMTKAGEQIFHELGRDPKKVTLVRRFMNYYLPTSEKLMDTYRQLMDAPVKGENITSAMERIENSMGVVANAFEKYADNLFKDDEMDIDAEIKVMSTMLSGDSLLDNAPNDIRSVRPSVQPASQAAPKAEATDPEEMEGKDRKITLTLGGH